tara:strand:+ start:129658 stop:130212 length:555 start_codon:yes stop_codon:yes gene_type:complete
MSISNKPKTMKKPKKHYVDSNELEKTWATWLETDCPLAWERLQSDVYKICQGVAVHFNPRDEEERLELSHETYVLTVEKIKDKRLVFEPGRAPVFNFLTTTIFRHLYSLMNKKNRRKKLLMTKYLCKPGVLDSLVCVSDVGGGTYKHPESSRILSTLLPQLLDDTAALSKPKLKKSVKKPSASV